MLKHSQLFLADLVEKSKVSIRTETYQFADLVADVLDSVVICDAYDYRLIFEESLDTNFDLLCTILLFLQLIVSLIIVEKVSSQFQLSPAKNGKRLFFFLFRKITSLQATNGHALADAHPFLIGTPSYLVKILRKVELLQKICRILLD